MAKVLITGASGLVGTALCDELQRHGFDIYKLVRRKPIKSNEIYFNYTTKELDLNLIENFDYAINLAGENIAEGRWTSNKKEKIYNSRIGTTKFLVESLNKLKQKPRLLISASAIGYYDSSKEYLTENDLPGKTFLSQICIDWEKEAKQFSGDIAIGRIGVVLADHGGAVRKMILPFSLGLGCFLGDGKQYMSCITLTDLVNAFIFILNKNLSGEFNLVSPTPVTNREFSLNLAKRFNKSVYFSLPAFMIKLIFGKEFAEELLLANLHVLPKNLLANGFEFKDK